MEKLKKIHLISNAHLDPAWLWRWNEGLAEAISTFRVAADFLEQYDGYIFNHNEALLYMWVEEHEPKLFERIKKLVAEGKWIILGGWYLQPDVVMTSGESIISQIELGREYFTEKFGKAPTTAANLDSFGHSRGLVQILTKMGYTSYVIGRPESVSGHFNWEGYDGSLLHTYKIVGGYNSGKGKATNKIKLVEEQCAEQEVAACFWGIGNHGGGASREDLEKIDELMKKSGVKIFHSDATSFLNEIDTKDLPVISNSLVPCMVGCITSMVRVKQGNRRLENKIATTEKIWSYAAIAGGDEYPKEQLDEAKRALAFCQFHDILPGSGIKKVEVDSLNTLGYGEEIVDRLFTKAFLKLCSGQKKAKDGELPIMVFNPHPYEVEGEFEVGFMLANQNWAEDEKTLAFIFDEQGCPLPVQNEKPDCTFNLDWIEKISFRGKLKPSSITRFDCRFKTVKIDTLPATDDFGDAITVKNGKMEVSISRKTGLIDSYKIDGKTLVAGACALEVYRDNEDPWGMTVSSFTERLGQFTLMSDEEANEFIGYPEQSLPNVRVIENGAVRVKVQAIFKYGRSVATVIYTIPKAGSYVDINITMLSLEVNRMIRMSLGESIKGSVVGETAFGKEELFRDGTEFVYHKWCGIEGDAGKLYVLNSGTYGGAYIDDSLKISLLRTPVYSAHPIHQRPIAPRDRAHEHIDMGQRSFDFRLCTSENASIDAQIYNEQPQLLSFFPSGDGTRVDSVVKIDNGAVQLSSMRKIGDGYKLTLFNPTDLEQSVTLSVSGYENKKLTLSPFELKFINF